MEILIETHATTYKGGGCKQESLSKLSNEHPAWLSFPQMILHYPGLVLQTNTQKENLSALVHLAPFPNTGSVS